MNANAWAGARDVLCVRLDYLGDVLMSTPAIRALRQTQPGRRITLLTSPAGAAVARLVPCIDDVIEYDAPWVKHSRASLSSIASLVERLRRRRFDAAVIFTVYSQSPLPAAMACSAAGIPLRLAHCRENPYLLLSDWVHECEPEHGVRHEVERQIDLVRHVGCIAGDKRLVLSVPDGARQWARERLAAFALRQRRWVLVHPGASAPSRRYPIDMWAEALETLAAQQGCAIVLVGARGEAADIEALRKRLGAVDVHCLTGDFDLSGLAACIELAPVLLCNNSGPAHIAAAVGTPVVSLYALTNPQHTPWMVAQRVLFRDVACRFCQRSECPQGHHACLRGVDPDDVARAASALLSLDDRSGGVPTPTIIDLLAADDTEEALP